ncbi:MAG: hypothetical protein Q7J85_11915 [Bacillota bacterium]|nr:hypothetical protein [Bacillota bacterium]
MLECYVLNEGASFTKQEYRLLVQTQLKHLLRARGGNEAIIQSMGLVALNVMLMVAVLPNNIQLILAIISKALPVIVL